MDRPSNNKPQARKGQQPYQQPAQGYCTDDACVVKRPNYNPQAKK